MVFHQAEIAGAVHFQEQYFDYTIDSLVRRSCGVIPYRQTDGTREYLVVLQTNNCWSFPKGHMERGETEPETALRELFEETGLTAELTPGVRAVSEYRTHLGSLKQVVLFLGRVNGDVIPQEKEVVDWRWVRAEELKDYLHPDTYEACTGCIF
ncbi:MAG: NUDIX domain-containing protein [Oscillospiraceae bacterium]|nr:NUDIX domain-containing protein [Oscillospiraceae bacterium]